MVNTWCNGEANYGIKLSAANVTNSESAFYSSEEADSEKIPFLAIKYNMVSAAQRGENKTVDISRAGKAEIDDFSGNLVLSREDIGFNGKVMPVNITMIYNLNNGSNPTFGFGFKTNYNQTINAVYNSGKLQYYEYVCGDGSKIYFYYNNIADKYIDMSGRGYTIKCKDKNETGTYNDSIPSTEPDENESSSTNENFSSSVNSDNSVTETIKKDDMKTVNVFDKYGNNLRNETSEVNDIYYTYDEAGHLTTEVNVITRTGEDFVYDKGGNVVEVRPFSRGRYGQSHTFTYGNSNWKDLPTAYNGNEITYDEIGNPLTYYNGTEFKWTMGRRLKSAVRSDGIKIKCTYNADGLRTSKTINNVKFDYYWNDGKLSAQTYAGNTMYFRYDGDTPLGFEYNNSQYYYVTDLLGSIIAVKIL